MSGVSRVSSRVVSSTSMLSVTNGASALRTTASRRLTLSYLRSFLTDPSALGVKLNKLGTKSGWFLSLEALPENIMRDVNV